VGQGNYTAIVWGASWCVPEDSQPVNELIEEWSLGRNIGSDHICLKTQYECRMPWIGFMVGDSDGNINTRYEPTSEDPFPQRGLCFYSMVIPLNQVETLINSSDPDALKNAKTLWLDFSEEIALLGVRLPPPELLLVNDFH
jgi:hypothetical protein